MKKITSVTDITSSPSFIEATAPLYGNSAEGQLLRYVRLYEKHTENYPQEGYFFSSPGRIEVIGNHTDHNHGKVVAAAISLDTLAFVSLTNNKMVTIASEGYSAFSVDLNNLDASEDEYATSIALVRGVARWFNDKGYKIGGFTATVTSNVFKGAGVSSSASFEVLIGEIFNIFYNNGTVTNIEQAQAAQYAENVYFGKPCGLMDQSAIALGGVSLIDFKEVEKPSVVNVAWAFDNIEIIITNTGGNHADLTGDYSAIRYEMEEVAKYFEADNLREVDAQKFFLAVPELQNKVSGRAILRAAHFYDENQRVEKAVAAITYNNLDGFINMINESGNSSYKLLQNCYAPEDTAQRIPLAIMLSKKQDGVKAVRVHGGGFEGTVIAYVEKSDAERYAKYMKSVFGEDNVFKLNIRSLGACYVEL